LPLCADTHGEEKRREGTEGEERVGERRGGREFVLCPRKKKEKSAPMHTPLYPTPSSGVRIVLMDVRGGTRNVS